MPAYSPTLVAGCRIASISIGVRDIRELGEAMKMHMSYQQPGWRLNFVQMEDQSDAPMHREGRDHRILVPPSSNYLINGVMDRP